MLRVAGVVQLVVAEWHVGYGQVKAAVTQFGGFKSLRKNGLFRIQQLCDPGSNAIKLNAGDVGLFVYVIRHQANEVANAHRRLKNFAALKAHTLNGIPHCHDDFRRSVVSVRCGSARFFKFFWRKKFAQFGAPAGQRRVGLAAFGKHFWKATPANIPGKGFLLVFGSLTARLLNFLERANGRKIVVEFCDLSTFPNMVIWGNAIIFYPSRPGSACGQKSCIATSRAVGHASASLIPLSISFFAVSSRVLSALATCS